MKTLTENKKKKTTQYSKTYHITFKRNEKKSFNSVDKSQNTVLILQLVFIAKQKKFNFIFIYHILH